MMNISSVSKLAFLVTSLAVSPLSANPLKDWYAGTPTIQGVERWSLENGDSPQPVLHYAPGGRYAALWCHFEDITLSEGKTLTVKASIRIEPPIKLTSGLLSFGLFNAPKSNEAGERFLGNDLTNRGIGIDWQGFFVSRYGISQRREGNTTFFCVGGSQVTGLPKAQTYGELGPAGEYQIILSVQKSGGETKVFGTVSDGMATQNFSGASDDFVTETFNTFGLMNADFLGASNSLEIIEATVQIE